MKTSRMIRMVLEQARESFNANDNISKHLDSDAIENIRIEVEAIVGDLLDALVIDRWNDPNSIDTPKRVSKMLVNELYAGRYTSRPDCTIFPNTRKNGEMFTVGPVNVRSSCSHHLVPVYGDAWIGVVAADRLLGLSKFARLTKWVMSRPQIQEESVIQLGEVIEDLINPRFLAVAIKAKHLCMSCRGVEERDASMVTTYFSGEDSHDRRQEFFQLIKAQGF